MINRPPGTARRERFDPEAMTAAKRSRTSTHVHVMNTRNGKPVIVRVIDSGSYASGRCLDLSQAAFRAIEDLGRGVTTVRYEVLA